MTIVQGSMPAPITMAKPHEGLIPHSYIAVRKSQRCLCCGNYTEWSEVYSRTLVKSTTESSWGRKFGVFLRRLDAFKYRLPLEQSIGPHEEIPFCHKCYKPSLEHNYDVLDPPRADVIPGPGNLSSSTAPKAKPSAPAKPATLDKLLDMMS
jgi:hypothetical protein